MKNFTVNTLYALIKISISLIFFWSGVNKLLDPEAFSVTIDAFGLVPEMAVQPLTYFLPILEIILSILLVFEVRGGLGSISFLLLFFICLLSYGIYIGLDIDCGCFGAEDPEKRAFSSLRAALYRDIIILFGLGFMFYHRMKKEKR